MKRRETMMFADDVVICAERQEEVEERLERWRRALEDRGMRISRKKTEYLCVGGRESPKGRWKDCIREDLKAAKLGRSRRARPKKVEKMHPHRRPHLSGSEDCRRRREDS